MTGWIITAVVFAFFTIILITSVKCKLAYKGEDFLVKAGVLCFWFTLFPQKEKSEKVKKTKKKSKNEKKKADNSETQKPKKKKDKLDFSLIRNLIDSGLKGLQTLWRHLIFYNLCIRITVGDEDAAECALHYGKLCGLIYGGIAAAKNIANLDEKEISLFCDFSKNETEYDVEAAVRIRIAFVLGAAVRMLFHLVVNTIKNNRQDRVPT